ncbi:MAG: cysteine dioxygenase [Sphingomonadales bacterium]|nr:cysteine dioxygenase [Sphingomonadales bacterium]
MNAIGSIRSGTNLARLRLFVGDIAALIESTSDEAILIQSGSALLEALIATDDWLPDEYAKPHPARYQQYLLHADSLERFSIVSFVWGPGQSTPIHDHRVWGLVGVLRGAERVESFSHDGEALVITELPVILAAGQVDAVSPEIGDIHRVANGYDDRVSISIHVYGANIGAVERATYDVAGMPKRFVSGYANTSLPNLWDRSKAS